MTRAQNLALTLIAAWRRGSWFSRALLVLAAVLTLSWVAVIVLNYFSVVSLSGFGPPFLVPIVGFLWIVVFYESLQSELHQSKSRIVEGLSSKQPQPLSMPTVLVVTALQDEMDAVLDLMPNGRLDWNEHQIDEGYFYYEKVIENDGSPFVIKVTSQAQPGPTYATAHTTLMLKDHPDILFMTGICAGNQKEEKELALGDIIIGDMAFHYETGKHVEDGFNPEIECSNVDPVVVQWLKDYRALKKGVLEVDNQDRKLYIGPFATGSSVVSKKEIFANLQKRERKVVALDMEAYSVLKAAEISNQKIPAVVIKGVSDFADPEKDDKAHKLAAKSSAKCMLEIAKRFITKLPAREQTSSPTRVTYPLALPRPAVTYGDRLQWRALLKWPQDDNWGFSWAKDFETGEYDESSEHSGLIFYDLGANKWLLEVVVGYGAYNGTYRYYFLDETQREGRWKEVHFRSLIFTEDGDQIVETVSPEIDGNAWFVPETNQIKTFYKGRGIGDIGQLITYDFKGGSTELVEFRHNSEEYDSENTDFVINPQEWPQVDVSRNYPTLT